MVGDPHEDGSFFCSLAIKRQVELMLKVGKNFGSAPRGELAKQCKDLSKKEEWREKQY